MNLGFNTDKRRDLIKKKRHGYKKDRDQLFCVHRGKDSSNGLNCNREIYVRY